MDIHRNNAFSSVAIEVAYREGREWLDQLLPYLSANFDFVKEYCEKNIPQIKPNIPDATYLVWLDCRDLGMSNDCLLYTSVRSVMVQVKSLRKNALTVMVPDTRLSARNLKFLFLQVLTMASASVWLAAVRREQVVYTRQGLHYPASHFLRTYAF